jgi:hypothetical protein
MKKIISALAVIAIIVVCAYVISYKRAAAPSTNPVVIVPATPAMHCGLRVTRPLPGSQVTFPLEIKAVVDNTGAQNLGCSWGAFEAQAGSIVIQDMLNNTLATGVLSTTDNWMTSDPVAYAATIPALSNPNYTGPLVITFTEDNAQGIPNPDTLTIQVTK